MRSRLTAVSEIFLLTVLVGASAAEARPIAYVAVSGLLHGEGTHPYRVPVEILHPASPDECSGVAVVDFVNNNAMFVFELDGVGFSPPTAIGRLLLTEDLLADLGAVYVSVQFQGLEYAAWPARSSAAALSGTYERFSDEELRDRYPTHFDYFREVHQGVLHALARRWILPRDAMRYLIRALQCDVGRSATLTEEDHRYCYGL